MDNSELPGPRQGPALDNSEWSAPGQGLPLDNSELPGSRQGLALDNSELPDSAVDVTEVSVERGTTGGFVPLRHQKCHLGAKGVCYRPGFG